LLSMAKCDIIRKAKGLARLRLHGGYLQDCTSRLMSISSYEVAQNKVWREELSGRGEEDGRTEMRERQSSQTYRLSRPHPRQILGRKRSKIPESICIVYLYFCIINMSLFSLDVIPKSFLGIDIGSSALRVVEIGGWGDRRSLRNYGAMQVRTL
jgi:hypothetical protein